MKRYVITVTFVVRDGCLAAFVPLIRENARRSLAEEPGCRRFDVLRPSDGGNVVFLYEIYDDEHAFDAHCASAHFLEFDRASRDLYENKTVRRYEIEDLDDTRTR